MSFAPARMKWADMLILEKDLRKATTALGRLGVLHLVEVKSEQIGATVSRLASQKDLDRVNTLAARLAAISEQAGLPDLSGTGEDTYEAMDVVDQQVSALEARISPLLEKRERLETESEELQDELARLDAVKEIPVPLERILASPFLHFAIGSIRSSDIKRLRAEARDNVMIVTHPGQGDKQDLVAITSRKGRFALETLLKQHDFERTPIAKASKGIPADVRAGLIGRIDELRERQKNIRLQLREIAQENAEDVATLRRQLDLERGLIEAQMNFGHTSSTCVISGWLPEDCLAAVSERLLEETEGRLVFRVREVEQTGASPEDVPVLMKHHPLVRPFQLLVTTLGVPRYNEVEPTLLVAVSFLAMYGLMFGDVGHGAVMAVGGLLLHWRGRDERLRDIGSLIAMAGLASALCGFLYGSVFGKEILHPLWLRPMENVMVLLQATVVLGVVLISLGVILSIVNKVRSGHYLHAIFDRYGVVGIVFYWGSLGLGLRRIVLGPGGVNTIQVGLLVVLPLVILFFREPLLFLLTRRRDPDQNGLWMVIFGGVDVMETVMTYLANTVSFTRIGAFALAHAGLSVAIFTLEGMVRRLPGGGLWSVIIIVAGNIVILGLEGLVVFIQCLRLQYYEFFSKFFHGSGTRYKPFRIR